MPTLDCLIHTAQVINGDALYRTNDDITCSQHAREQGCRKHEGEDNEPHLCARSEEHTSELQSPCNLVCRLLLEKKNKDKLDIYAADDYNIHHLATSCVTFGRGARLTVDINYILRFSVTLCAVALHLYRRLRGRV